MEENIEVGFPPKIWEELMEDYLEEVKNGEIEMSDVKFNIAILDESAEILNKFKDSSSQLDGVNNPELVKSKVEELVIALNLLSAKHNDFIMTGEREDLCLWIDELILQTGYPLKEDEDLTLDYREW